MAPFKARVINGQASVKNRFPVLNNGNFLEQFYSSGVFRHLALILGKIVSSYSFPSLRVSK